MAVEKAALRFWLPSGMWKPDLRSIIIAQIVTFLEPFIDSKLQGKNCPKIQGQTDTCKERLNAGFGLFVATWEGGRQVCHII